MSDHTTSSAAGEPASPRPSAAPGQGFFDWLRRLSITRGDSWLGGVCGGVAARLGIDPIIVRGIAVVIALLGGPAFLAYAVAWLLLPDETGSIHLERLVRGVFDAATVGVGVFVLLAFLPLAQGVWWAAGWPLGGGLSWGSSLGHVFWSLVVIAAAVALVVWVSRRAGWGSGRARGAGGAAWRAPSGSGAQDPAGPWAASSAAPADAAVAPPAGPAPSFPTAPTAPRPGASPAADADWRDRQADWRVRYDEWKRHQADSSRAAREARLADASRRQADALEQARIHRLTHPRASGPFVAIALGVAVIVGALASGLAWNVPALAGFQSAFGFAAATAVVGLAMTAAGLMRRSSGFLAFVAIVLTVVTAALLAGATGYSSLFDALRSVAERLS